MSTETTWRRGIYWCVYVKNGETFYGVTTSPESAAYLQSHKTGEGEAEYLATLTYRYTAI
jgi:hypothetical protein